MDGPRASDAEREQVVADLQRHYSEGRLTGDEFEERVSWALAAVTLRDLYAVIGDLPVPSPVDVRSSTSPGRRRRWRRA